MRGFSLNEQIGVCCNQDTQTDRRQRGDLPFHDHLRNFNYLLLHNLCYFLLSVLMVHLMVLLL